MPLSKVPLCGSHIWGNPDLPEGFPLPVYTDSDGTVRPYFFIGQFDMGKIAFYDRDNLLPHTGLLQIYAKIDHYIGLSASQLCIREGINNPDSSVVLYFPDTDTMEERIIINPSGNPIAPASLTATYASQPAEGYEYLEIFPCLTPKESHQLTTIHNDVLVLFRLKSFAGAEFSLDFPYHGFIDFVISSTDLAKRDFSSVKALLNKAS